MKDKFDNWMFGCDVCQDVCPWNRFSKEHSEPLFRPKPCWKVFTYIYTGNLLQVTIATSHFRVSIQLMPMLLKMKVTQGSMRHLLKLNLFEMQSMKF